MKEKIIYILFISLFMSMNSHAQQTVLKEKESEKQFFIGADLLNPVVSFFSDKKNYNIYLSYKIKGRWVIAAEAGYEENIYKKNDWNVEGEGAFVTAGFNYILSNNYEKTGEGFFIGGRAGFSPFKQHIKGFPIKASGVDGMAQTIGTKSLAEKNVSAGWIELVAGAKAQTGNSPFHLDFMVKPKFTVFSKKQEGIDNLVVPGYGKDKGAMNISLIWGVSYKLY